MSWSAIVLASFEGIAKPMPMLPLWLLEEPSDAMDAVSYTHLTLPTSDLV